MGRLNPSLAIERNKYEQQLADQGIQYGSPAYENAMRNYSMQANDARFAAIAQGGQEQQRLSDIAQAGWRVSQRSGSSSSTSSNSDAGNSTTPGSSRASRRRRSAARLPTPRRRRTSSRRNLRSTHPTPRGSSTSTSSSRCATSRSTRSAHCCLGHRYASPNFLQHERADHPDNRRCRADQSKLRSADGGVQSAGGDGKQHHWRAIRLRRRAWAAAAHSTSRAKLCRTHITIFSPAIREPARLPTEQLEARRKIAIALATRNRPYPKTIGEGLLRWARVLAKACQCPSARDEAAYQKQSDADVRRLTGQGATPAAPRGYRRSIAGGRSGNASYAYGLRTRRL